MKKVLIICGPTATGKTSLGIKLAKKFSGEIISADSRQVYKNMDIGTGKDIPQNSKSHHSKIIFNNEPLIYYLIDNIKLWGYDLVNPSKDFSVAHFHQLALKLINNLLKTQKIPIIVGGTGLYLNSLIKPIDSINIRPNFPLRRQLNSLTLKQLQIKLKKINLQRFSSMNQADQQNPRRLIRAIEISKFEQTHNTTPIQSLPKLDILWIGITAPQSVIDSRIEKRVNQRLKDGMEIEVSTLIKKHPNWNTQAFSSTGYQEIRKLLNKQISRTQAIQDWITAEKQYSRRQLTWFKTNPLIHWFDITQKNYLQIIVRQINHWYT